MTPRKDEAELRRHIKALLMEMPSARVVMALIVTEDEGPPIRESISFITSDNFDTISDAVAVADQLLRRVGGVLASRMPDDWSRGRLAKVEAARAALNFEQRGTSS